ncbi:MAG TPA: hypothetical protein DCE44_08255 [Verrucomicrobiales bacterium]|nr:hypothetical protein [Verrucomicrobiales bacterium]
MGDRAGLRFGAASDDFTFDGFWAIGFFGSVCRRAARRLVEVAGFASVAVEDFRPGFRTLAVGAGAVSGLGRARRDWRFRLGDTAGLAGWEASPVFEAGGRRGRAAATGRAAGELAKTVSNFATRGFRGRWTFGAGACGWVESERESLRDRVVRGFALISQTGNMSHGVGSPEREDGMSRTREQTDSRKPSAKGSGFPAKVGAVAFARGYFAGGL